MARTAPLAFSVLLHAGAAGAALLLGAGGDPREGAGIPPCLPDPRPVALEVAEGTGPVLFRESGHPVLFFLPDEPELEFEPVRERWEPPEPEGPPRPPRRYAPSFDRPLSPARSSHRLPPAAALAAAIVEAPPAEIHNPPPEYPPAARRRGLEGEALVEITVLPDGTCGEARLVECTGSPLFGEAALSAVRCWRYRPALRGGRTVESVARVRFLFRLRA